MTRKDKVAAVVFVGALTPRTLEAIKKQLLSMAGKQADRPDPSTRLGLALIALTTPDIKEPSAKEIRVALKQVVPLWTDRERMRVAMREALRDGSSGFMKCFQDAMEDGRQQAQGPAKDERVI